MAVTPSQLFALAVSRHREPWNWTFHCAALVLFCLCLLAHSYLFLAASLILLGAGFFRLPLDPPPDNRWFRFTRRFLQWERNWSATPWTGRKIARLAFAVLAAAVTIWALWTREPAALALLAGFLVLSRVVSANREGGIDP